MTYVYNGDDYEKNGDYKISITVNDKANRQEVYQSNISSREITEDMSTDSSMLEGYASERYKIPEDKEVSFDNHGGTDALRDSTVGKNVTEYVPNAFEETICDLLLAVGDFTVNLMNQIVGEEVTITKLVYNQVDAVNPNFFDKTVSATGITADITKAVSNWYDIFKMVAIAVYLVILLGIGINVLLASTGNGMAKGKELLVSWIKGLVCLVFIPYFIKYAFLLNEALVEMLAQVSDVPAYKIGSAFEGDTAWSTEEIEFRSPEFVSNYTGSVAFGSDDATKSYVNKVSTYEQNLDLMRIMRAYAGATKKFIYAVIWWILIGQLIAFIIQYYKRYFMIAFLIAMFPIVCVFYGIKLAQGKTGNEISSWMKEMFTNIFIQLIQAIIYTIITGICVSIVKEDIQSSATLNWLIIILAINFVSEGEKLLRKIMGAMGSSVEGTGKAGQGAKGAFKNIKNNVQKLMTGISDGDNKK